MTLLALVRKIACHLGLVSQDAIEEVPLGEEEHAAEIAEEDISSSEDVSDADDDLPPLEEVSGVDGFLAGARVRGTCAVCFDEGMMLQLDCQHTICSECLDTQLAQRWPGLRMTFGYLHCGVCRAPLAHESVWDTIQAHLELKDEVLKVSTEQYVADGSYTKLCKTLGRNPTINELDALVEAEMAVYACGDCREPYCAGRVQCLDALEQEAHARHLQCRSCEWYAQPALREVCDIPGHKDCQIFKCNSCCDLAVWHCGPNRYCDRCHRETYAHKDYPCPGLDKCPLGRPHPPNAPAPLGTYVEPFVVGCTACLEVNLGCRVDDAVAGAFHAEGQWQDYDVYDDDDVGDDDDDVGFCDDERSTDVDDASSDQSDRCDARAPREALLPDAWEAVKQRREADRALSSCRGEVRRAHLAAKRARWAHVGRGHAGERGQRFRGGRHKVSAVPWPGDDDCSSVAEGPRKLSALPWPSDDDCSQAE